MKKRIVIGIFAIVILIPIAVLLNPLRKTSERLRLEQLKTTPIGMKLSEVEKIARGRGRDTAVLLAAGFHKQELGDDRIVGVKSISTEASDYWTFPFLTTSVTFFWGFDKDDKLVDVWVWKTVDAP